MPPQPPHGEGATLTAEETDRELERLRAEVGDLRAKLADAQAHGRGRRRRPGWRGPVATLLIVLGCLLAPMSVLAVWTANQVSNTGRYVQNVAPLIAAPAVQGALTDKIATAVTDQMDVKAVADRAAKELTARGLPRIGALVSSFSGSIASGVAGFVHGAVAKIVRSPLVARLWVQGNTVAHTQLVRALSGQASSLSVANGKVVIGLGPFIDRVKRNLAARGLGFVAKLPAINPTFPLFSASYLVRAQSLYRLLNAMKWALPVLTLLLFAGGVYVARRHRRALVGAGLGLAAAMLVLGAAIAVTRAIYLSKVPSGALPADAAAVVFDTLVRFIKQGLRVILVLGLVVAVGAFFAGPSVTAVRTRSAIASAFGAVRGTGERAGVTTGPVGAWMYRHKNALRVLALAVAVLIFVFWTNPTGLAVLAIALVLLGVVGLIELVARPPAAAATPVAGRPPPPRTGADADADARQPTDVKGRSQ